MNIIDKNNYYHTILSILRKPDSEQDKAREIVLYLQEIINELQSNQENQENEEDHSMNLPPAKFGKTFRRV
jgi:uncharacterized protein (DUF2225 family)